MLKIMSSTHSLRLPCGSETNCCGEGCELKICSHTCMWPQSGRFFYVNNMKGIDIEKVIGNKPGRLVFI
jgi:hypothetical protein